MKTKKIKAGSQSVNVKGSAETTGKKDLKDSNYVPDNEEIRKKAVEIYHERLARNEEGTSEDDWLKAEKLLKGAKK